MATSDLYEQWEERVALEGKAEGKAEGLALGLVRNLMTTYEARFGPMSPSLRRAVGKIAVPASAEAWMKLFVLGSPEEIAAAIRKKQPPSR